MLRVKFVAAVGHHLDSVPERCAKEITRPLQYQLTAFQQARAESYVTVVGTGLSMSTPL